jgi:hypothetical protein
LFAKCRIGVWNLIEIVPDMNFGDSLRSIDLREPFAAFESSSARTRRRARAAIGRPQFPQRGDKLALQYRNRTHFSPSTNTDQLVGAACVSQALATGYGVGPRLFSGNAGFGDPLKKVDLRELLSVLESFIHPPDRMSML